MVEFKSIYRPEVCTSRLSLSRADFLRGRGHSWDAPDFFSSYQVAENLGAYYISIGIRDFALRMLGKEIVAALWLVALLADIGLFFYDDHESGLFYCRQEFAAVFQSE